MGGGAPPEENSSREGRVLSLGNAMVDIPDAIVGEDAVLHPMRRPTRSLVGRAPFA